jgi:hypothetical protein
VDRHPPPGDPEPILAADPRSTPRNELMSRYHREPAVIEAAARWRDRCLLDDGSVLSETKRLWSLENLVHLERHFVDNPDDGEGGFFDKLEEQLSPAPAAAKQLAAELLWLLYLGVSEGAIRGGTKRLQIRRVWEWSGEPLPDAPRELEALDRGIANPGTAYQAQRWREFRFAIQLMRDWKRLPEPKRRALIADAWEFGAWVDAQTYSAGRQLRHFLLTMLFPEHFERIVSDQHKQKILKTFPARLGDAAAKVDYKDRLAVDRKLYQLRERLETEYDADPLDYYLEPLRSDWLGKGPGPGPTPPTDETEAWLQERFGDVRIWLIAPGQGARAWPEFQEIRDRGDRLGCGSETCQQYESRDEVFDALKTSDRDNPIMSALACWQFGHEIRPGDFVIAKQGRSVLLGYGVVTSEYRFDDSRAEFQHVLDVDWKREGHWPLEEDQRVSIKTVTDMTPYRDWLRIAFKLMDGDSGDTPGPDHRVDRQNTKTSPPEIHPIYTLAHAMESLFLSEAKLTTILDTLVRKKNVILEGRAGRGQDVPRAADRLGADGAKGQNPGSRWCSSTSRTRTRTSSRDGARPQRAGSSCRTASSTSSAAGRKPTPTASTCSSSTRSTGAI